MDHRQRRSLSKKMCMPVVKGPENRHDFASFEEKNSISFLKFSPFTPAGDPNYPLFPHRIDVPLVDHCSGFVSPGADAALKPSVGRAIQSLGDCSDVKPHQRIPITEKGGQIAHRRETILLEETSQNRRWNSRAVPAASVRARLAGWRTPVKVVPPLPDENDIFPFCKDSNLKVSSERFPRWREKKIMDYVYKSSTQKAYEEIPWDNILLPKIQPPESTVEVLADPVSQCFTKRRYNPEPDISQVVGGFWDRIQRRPFTAPRRPVNFVSRSSRTGHIPLYTGCIGAANLEDIDNADVDLIQFNHVRTSKPRYTSTAHTPNIPGYIGKVHWLATQPANSDLPSITPSIIAQMHGYIAKHGNASQYKHRGPLSQILTPVSPQNPFKKRERETTTVKK
ncbi:protein SPMIP7 [Podargus strigoides]